MNILNVQTFNELYTDYKNGEKNQFMQLFLTHNISFPVVKQIVLLCQNGQVDEAYSLLKQNATDQKPQPRKTGPIPMRISKQQAEEMKQKAMVEGTLNDNMQLWYGIIKEVMGIDVNTETLISVFSVIEDPKRKSIAAQEGIVFE